MPVTAPLLDSLTENFQADLIVSALADQFPVDLRSDVRAEVVRILPLLKEAGWSVDSIQWEPIAGQKDRRVTFSARSETGTNIHSTCPESMLATRLLSLLS
jgi:hypothetical protein